MELHEAYEVVREIHRATGDWPDAFFSLAAPKSSFVSFYAFESLTVPPWPDAQQSNARVPAHRIEIPWGVCGGYGQRVSSAGAYEQHGQTRRWWCYGPTVVVEVEPATTGILAWDVRDNNKGIIVDSGRLMAFVFKRDDSHFEWQVRRAGMPYVEGNCSNEAEATGKAEHYLRELLRFCSP